MRIEFGDSTDINTFTKVFGGLIGYVLSVNHHLVVLKDIRQGEDEIELFVAPWDELWLEREDEAHHIKLGDIESVVV